MQDEDFDTDQYEEKFLTETDKDFDEDLYEETIHKVVYKRSSIQRPQSSRKEGFDKFSRREGFDEKRDTSAKDKYYSRKSDYSGKQEQEDWYGRDLHDKPSRSWSHRPDKRGHRLSTRNKSDDRNNYYSVAKWQVDYNNKNYIRSKLNKHGGFHRYALGRPLDWDIEYDNMYYLRSFVNAPKGMHRVKQDIKRKLVPDKDILADSTGWEFEYGPMFKQEEGDVPFMPEERIVSRGAYRYYGVRRNPSDCDGKIQEKQMDFEELNKEELKYGREFLQDDVQHIVEPIDRIFGRGGYRYYDTDRNVFDARPADPSDIEYRESYATLGKYTEDEMSDDEEYTRKGKPFKHTIFKKVITLGSPPPVEYKRYTHLQFIPGEGSQSFHEGLPLRKGNSKAKKPQSSAAGSQAFTFDNSSRMGARSKKSDFSSSYKTSHRNKQNEKMGYHGSERGYKQKDGYDEELSEKSSLYQMRKHDILNFKNSKKSERNPDVDFGRETTDEHQVLKKFPPHIEERINTIKKNISRSEVSNVEEKNMRSLGTRLADNTNMDGQIDFKMHSNHPNDQGKSEKSKYERYVNKNGSEIWVKTEESYTELHHKGKQDKNQ